MGIMSAWLVLMLLYQLCISFFGFKRNTKNYQDHDPQMRFLVLVPAHNEEAVIADIIDNLSTWNIRASCMTFISLPIIARTGPWK